MTRALFDVQADGIDVRIEVSFSRLDPPEGRASRISDDDGRSPVGVHAFVGWLGLLGVLQLLAGEGVEPHRP
jgi:hypothetical protein